MRPLARLVAVLGAVAVAWVLFAKGPKDVLLVYEVPAGSLALEIELSRDGETIRRAEFRLPTGGDDPRRVRHPVRLPEGAYDLAWRLVGGGDGRGVRSLSVEEDATIVLSLAP